MSATITVFDGADSIGGNKIHMDFDGHGLFFDFGQNYKRMGSFYQEFLQPRSNRGLHDFVEMGLLPKIAQYREDVCPEDLDLTGSRQLKVDAVFISHAHMDHIGHAGFLSLNIPFVATPMTVAMMKAMKDCGQKGTESDSVYGNLRKRMEGEGRVIYTPRTKDPYPGRDFVLTESASAELEDFWKKSMTSRDIEAGEFLKQDSLDFEFQSFEVDHSIYGATAYAVDTSSGWVVYTGDLRAHGRYRQRTLDFVQKAKGLEPAMLIIEGTRTSRAEQGDNQSETRVKQTCLKAVEQEPKLVIADFGPRNFERLDSFMEIAQGTERRLVITKKDAYYLQSIQCVDGVDRMKGVSVYGALKAKETSVEEAACECLRAEVLDPKDIARDPDRYILCFSFYDMGNLLDIKHKGGTYIYSSSEAYSEEQIIDFRRLANWLHLFELKTRGFCMTGAEGAEEPNFDREYHASGHICTEDLIQIIKEISPRKVMPVHTEDPRPFSRAGCDLALPRPGVPIDF
jgi:ribonuclease J